MSVASALARFRAKQAEQFTATARIDRPTGPVAYDPVTKTEALPVVTLYASLLCKVTHEGDGRPIDAAGTRVRLVEPLVKFPVGTDVRMDDRVTILTSTYNPLSVGIVYRITEVDEREWQISRRCGIEETLVPMSWEDES